MPQRPDSAARQDGTPKHRQNAGGTPCSILACARTSYFVPATPEGSVQKTGFRPVAVGHRSLCVEGIEPSTHRSQICCSNQLSYSQWRRRRESNPRPPADGRRSSAELHPPPEEPVPAQTHAVSERCAPGKLLNLRRLGSDDVHPGRLRIVSGDAWSKREYKLCTAFAGCCCSDVTVAACTDAALFVISINMLYIMSSIVMARSSLPQFRAMLRRGGLLECAEATSDEMTACITLQEVELSALGEMISIAVTSAAL